MRINLQTSKIWVVSLLYALWLCNMTYVFYAVKGVADVSLQFALMAGGIPVAVQLILAEIQLREVVRPIIFTSIFIIIIILSFITNTTDHNMFIKLTNISFVFTVSIIIGSCPDYRIIMVIASVYAVISSAILLMVNLEGHYLWGRLFTDGIHPNFWGYIATSVGVTAFALRSRILFVACWIIVLITLFNTQARGSMAALFAAAGFVAAAWFVETRNKNLVLLFTTVILTLFGLVIAFDLMPREVTSFLYQDVLRLDDAGRGLDSGLSGRAETWAETLEIWMSNPIFGVGFRQHQFLLATSSSAHNAYLTMLADTGLFGLIAYVLLISFALWNAWHRDMPIRLRVVLLAVIISYAVLGLVERRALNAGNTYSILFLICCYYSLRTEPEKRSYKVEQRQRNGLKGMGESRLSG